MLPSSDIETPGSYKTHIPGFRSIHIRNLRLRHWLLKTEPDTSSFADLLAAPEKTTPWEGVRNFQTCNFLREMRRSEQVLIYQNATLAGDAGVVEVVYESVPDSTRFDAQSPTTTPEQRRTRHVGTWWRSRRSLPCPVLYPWWN